MTLLGVDYGRAHVGLAIGESVTGLAVPLATLHHRPRPLLLDDLRTVISRHRVTRVVVGVPVTWPEDRSRPGMREEAEAFAVALHEASRLPVELVDERLTSRGAAQLAKAAGRNGGGDEHALAAMLILQTYLDREAV